MVSAVFTKRGTSPSGSVAAPREVQIWDLDGVVTTPPTEVVNPDAVAALAREILSTDKTVYIVTGREWPRVQEWLLPVLEQKLGGWTNLRAPLKLFCENGAVSVKLSCDGDDSRNTSREGPGKLCSTVKVDDDALVPAAIKDAFQQYIRDRAPEHGFAVYGSWSDPFAARPWMTNEPAVAYVDMQPGRHAMVSPKLGLPSHLSPRECAEAQRRFDALKTRALKELASRGSSALGQDIRNSGCQIKCTAIAIDLQSENNTKRRAGGKIFDDIVNAFPLATGSIAVVGVGDSAGDAYALIPFAESATTPFESVTHIHVGTEAQAHNLLGDPTLKKITLLLPSGEDSAVFSELAVQRFHSKDTQIDRSSVRS